MDGPGSFVWFLQELALASSRPSFAARWNGGKMGLLEAGKRGLRRLDPPSGGRPGVVEHQVGSA